MRLILMRFFGVAVSAYLFAVVAASAVLAAGLPVSGDPSPTGGQAGAYTLADTVTCDDYYHPNRAEILAYLIFVVMSVHLIWVTVERCLAYWTAESESRQFELELATSLRFDNIEEAIASSDRHSESPVAAAVKGALQEIGSAPRLTARAVERIRLVCRRDGDRQTVNLHKGLTALKTICTTAPLVGLIAALVTLIDAFEGIRAAEAAGAGAASRVSMAMFDLLCGVILSLVAFVAHGLLSKKAESLSLRITNASSELLILSLKQKSGRALKNRLESGARLWQS